MIVWVCPNCGECLTGPGYCPFCGELVDDDCIQDIEAKPEDLTDPDPE